MKKNYLSYIVFGIFISLFYLLNSVTDIAIDDFVYKHLMSTDPTTFGVRVSSLYEIFTSMQFHYFHTNGRLLLNGLAQLFLMSDNKIVFDIVNSLMMGLLILLIYLHAGLKLNKIIFPNHLFIILCIWFLIPGPNHTLLWLDGSINYLWAVDFVLLFLLVYKKLLVTQKRTSYLILPFLFVFGLICGYTHEVITVGVAGSLFFYYIFNSKKLKLDVLLLVSGFMLGTFLLVTAPGNFVRLGSGASLKSSILDIFLQRCAIILTIPNNFAIILLSIALLLLKFKNLGYFKLFVKNNYLFLSSICISLLFILMAGAYQPRVFFGLAVFSIILLLIIFNDFKFSISKRLAVSVLGLLSLVMLIEWVKVYTDLKDNYSVFKSDEKIWRKSQENVFPDRVKKTNRFVSEGLGGIDREFWSNKAMSWYYKKDYMIFIPETLFTAIDSNLTNANYSKIKLDAVNSTLKENAFKDNSALNYEKSSGYFYIPLSNYSFNYTKSTIRFEGAAESSNRSLSLKDSFLHAVLKREFPIVKIESNFYYVIKLDGKKYILFQKPKDLSLKKPLTISLFDPKEILVTKISL